VVLVPATTAGGPTHGGAKMTGGRFDQPGALGVGEHGQPALPDFTASWSLCPRAGLVTLRVSPLFWHTPTCSITTGISAKGCFPERAFKYFEGSGSDEQIFGAE